MSYWLLKTEPETYGIEDLAKAGTDAWDGVRNFQARNNMQAMKKGDMVLIHHSGKNPGVAGIAKVAKEAYPDFTAWDKKSSYYDPKSSEDKPVWKMVDVEFVEKFKAEVPLALIKTDLKLKDMVLVHNSRLSVQPVTKAEFDRVLGLAK